MNDTRPPAARRRDAARAGHAGDGDAARAFLTDPDPAVRATAIGALARAGALDMAVVVAAISDPSPIVRARACEAAIPFVDANLERLLDDDDTRVVEAAAWSLGERAEAAAASVPALARVATTHDDALCREAAVAALGAIGHPAGLPAILAATTDKPAIRRRAVLALAPFEGEEVEAALRRAQNDTDWQTREAAETLLADGD